MKRKTAVWIYLIALAVLVGYTIATSDQVFRDMWFAGCAWTGGVLVTVIVNWDKLNTTSKGSNT